MQTCTVPHRLTGYIRIILLATVFLSGILPVTLVHADEGDFAWVKAMGADKDDMGYSIVVDTSGNVYTTGSFRGTVDFDPGPGTYNLSSVGTVNAVFISKLDSSGNFLWAKAISGANCIGQSITVDNSGNVYTTGFFWYTIDFDPGPGTSNLESEGWSDIFILKLDSNGDFVWAKAMGGTLYDNAYGIAVDTSGNVYTTGYFQGTADFDPDESTSETLTSTGGSQDIFVSKLDSNGDFVWAKAIGGTSNDIGYGLALDTSGNVYTTGIFQGTVDFDPGTGTYDLSNPSYNAAFISKLDTDGDFVWAKSMEGTLAASEGYGISVDTSGNAYTTGYFNGTGTVDFDPGPGTYHLNSTAGSQDIFVSKLDTSGNFVWAKAIGGSSNDKGYCLAIDASGNVYTTGYFQGTADFDPGTGTYNLNSIGSSQDIFASKLDSNGDFVWAKAMGGTQYEYGKGIAVDTSGNTHITGYFKGTTDFDPGPGTFNLTSTDDSEDIFIVRLGESFPWSIFMPAITKKKVNQGDR